MFLQLPTLDDWNLNTRCDLSSFFFFVSNFYILDFMDFIS